MFHVDVSTTVTCLGPTMTRTKYYVLNISVYMSINGAPLHMCNDALLFTIKTLFVLQVSSFKPRQVARFTHSLLRNLLPIFNK